MQSSNSKDAKDSKNYTIINVSEQYVRKVNIGKFGVCEIPGKINVDIQKIDKNIFLKTKYKEWLWLQNKKKYIIESENTIRNMWLCKIISFEDMTELIDEEKESINEEDKESINEEDKESIEIVKIVYGRCIKSMTMLDKIYRKYIYKHKFRSNDIVAIKSVAGSGKTTTLLELAKTHKKKRILYIAFNKSLITEIRSKIREQKIKNLFPVTFDALMRDVYIAKKHDEPDIFDLKPQTLPNAVEWFKNKPYKIKDYYVKNYLKFCNQTQYSDIKEYSKKNLGGEKKLLTNMWSLSLKDELITFDTIRKLVEINHWCKGYIDANYDMIFIDESQDFDNIMLKILLEDTTIPKVFVGDPRQAIYEWKGCINAFDKLPESALTMEFYSTFRVGNPACDQISQKFDNCHMISSSINDTRLILNDEDNSIKIKDMLETNKYVYLFRSWKNLLQNAQHIKNIWIYNYDAQVEFIKKLHNKLMISKLDEEELNDFADDLPKFLLKLSLEELEKLIKDIQKNIVSKNDAHVEMYTIHSYKGLESDYVRIFNDIDIKNEKNLYYVALTRGKKYIILDTALITNNYTNDNKKQLYMGNFVIKDGAIIL